MLLQEAFKILNLTEGVSRAEIRHAYANLSKLYHVETHPEEFALLHEAYKIALSAAGNKNEQTVKENLQGSEPFTFSKDSKNRQVFDLSETKKTYPSTLSHMDFLDYLLDANFSIQNCSEPIQLLYYRYRYDEISPETESMLLRITNAEQGIIDHSEISMEVLSLSDGKKFFKIPWRKWKILDWTCIICHPDFYKVQNTPAFLTELYQFLYEETLNLRDGIRQELYFALCITYGFFFDEMREIKANPTLAKIETLLRLHPKHREYTKDLELWSQCKEARRIVLFCQKVYAKFLLENNFALDTDQNQDSDTDKTSLSETAAELLLDEEIPWKEFIYDCLTKFFDTVLSGQSAKDHKIFDQFINTREEFLELSKLRREFARDFIDLLDNNITENYIYNMDYLPLALRLARIKDRYFTKRNWKKIVCYPIFFQKFKNWLLPRHNGFFSVPCIMHYDAWKLLRKSFEGSSPFEMDCISYLTTEFYFPEYEKRYQKELIWEKEHIEESYLKEIRPIPVLNQGKLDFLHSIESALPARIEEIEKIWGNLSFDLAGLDFLTRIARAMTHFNFLIVTQKYEKEAVPGDAFCFLQDEVLLYRKKENLLCRMTHPIFYDLISWKFEAAAFHALNGKPVYDEDFLNTACRDLYCYRYYAAEKREE